MTIFLQFFRLSASFCPGAACPAVGPQAAQIPRQVGIAAPDMSGIQHLHAAPVPHTKARQHQCCPAPQVWCSHSGTMQFCAAAKIQQPSLAAGISPQGGKALRTGKAVLEQAVINAGCSLRPQQHRRSQRCLWHTACAENGCAELCRLFCESDNVTYGGLRKIGFSRTKTLGCGGNCCDFHFFRKQ